MSKKMFPLACTLMRAWLVERLGSSTDSEPSLGVLTASATGKVAPPFVERRIVTVVALIGEAVVPATSQLTVRKPDQITAVFGEVTLNGPAEPTTVTAMSSVVTPPPPTRLSRAVTRKFIVREVVGSSSPGASELFNKSDSLGNVRTGLAVGGKDRNKGLLPLSAALRLWAGAKSCFSQQYVIGLPFGSRPEAVRAKGVRAGITKLPPASTDGAPFPVAVTTAQSAPKPTVV